MHLGRALADQAGDGEEQLVALARGGALGLRDEPRLLELAVEVVERPAPAVALVGDEAEEGGVGRGLAVRADALDRAQERRGVPEVRHVGEEAADLDLGVDAGLEPAVGLHDHPVADQDRAVALLGTEAAHRRVLGQLQLAAPLPRLAADLALGGGDGPPLAHGGQQLLREAVRVGGVVEGAQARAAARLGQRVGPQGGPRRQVLLAPRGGERQEVALPGPLGEGHVELGQEVDALPAAQLARRLELDRADRAVLGREPALLRQVGRQGLAAEVAADAALGDAAPAVGQHHGDEVGKRLGHRASAGPERVRPRQAGTRRSRGPAGSAGTTGR